MRGGLAPAGPLQRTHALRIAPARHLQLSQLPGHRWQFAATVAVRRRRGDALRTAAAEWVPPPFDPDTYEEEPEDEDDYMLQGSNLMGDGVRAAAAAPVWGSSAQPSMAGPPSFWGIGAPPLSDGACSSSSAEQAREQPSPPADEPRRPQRPDEVLNSSYTMLLLFFSAVNRLLSQLSTAVVATVRVTWQLGGEALQMLRQGSVKAKEQAEVTFANSPAGKKVQRWQKKIEATQQELPEDLWGKVMWVWDRPGVQKLRLTISMANFSIRLPALVALVATQIGLLSTSLSLPMLAPLLLGTGMLMRSIRTNASLVFPRIGLLVVLLWLLWFANSVIQNTVVYLRKQGAIDQRMANNINSAAELTVLLTAGVVLLSMLGVNVSALLLPAGVAIAIASRDLSLNFLAGFFLMMVQPFRLGDRVGVTLPAGSPGGFGGGNSWFEGVCEKVDLRYTSLRQGKRRLMVPNSAFLQQPFMILEDMPQGSGHPESGTGPDPAAAAPAYAEPFVWKSYMDGAPVHQELAREAAGPAAAGPAAAGPAAAAGQQPPGPQGQPLQGDYSLQQQQQQQYVQQAPPASQQQYQAAAQPAQQTPYAQPQPQQQPQQAQYQQQQQQPQQAQYQQQQQQQQPGYRQEAPMAFTNGMGCQNGWAHPPPTPPGMHPGRAPPGHQMGPPPPYL